MTDKTYIDAFSPVQDSAPTGQYTSSKYLYHFGIDNLSFSQISVHNNMCFVSEDIEVGILEEGEYLQLTADYNAGGNGSIEFYLVDGSESRPILPISCKAVENEKIFFGLHTRFSIDENEAVIVKKNGAPVEISLNQAMQINEDGYTVDYAPVDAHSIVTTSNTIKVKAILRTYDINESTPYIRSILIRKYGRSSSWQTANTIN